MIGNTVRQLRIDRKWTQEELADAAGMRQNHISAIESGRLPNPGGATLNKLARAFGVSVDELIAGEFDDDQEDAMLQHDRIVDLAGARGLPLEALAERARVPIAYIQSVEKGKIGKMSLAHVVSLALALSTSTDYLLGMTDDPNPRPPGVQQPLTAPNGERSSDVSGLLAQLSPENRDLIVAMIERAVEISKEPP